MGFIYDTINGVYSIRVISFGNSKGGYDAI